MSKKIICGKRGACTFLEASFLTFSALPGNALRNSYNKDQLQRPAGIKKRLSRLSGKPVRTMRLDCNRRLLRFNSFTEVQVLKEEYRKMYFQARTASLSQAKLMTDQPTQCIERDPKRESPLLSEVSRRTLDSCVSKESRLRNIDATEYSI